MLGYVQGGGLAIDCSITAREHRALEAPGDDQRTGVFVRVLMAMVRLYLRWSQYKITEREKVAHQVPSASGRWSFMTCAQCCGDRRHIGDDGTYRVFGKLIGWVRPSSSSMCQRTVPRPKMELTPLIPRSLALIGMGCVMKSSMLLLIEKED